MTGRKILVVDDDKEICDLFSMVLGSHGYTVTAAMTAGDALASLRAAVYNAVLLDIGLPDMQGTLLLEKMRAINPGIIIIMVTGHPELETAISAINDGADGYCVKPVSNRDLVSLLEKKLRHREDSIRLTDERVSEWLESRLSRLDLENGKIGT